MELQLENNLDENQTAIAHAVINKFFMKLVTDLTDRNQLEYMKDRFKYLSKAHGFEYGVQSSHTWVKDSNDNLILKVIH